MRAKYLVFFVATALIVELAFSSSEVSAKNIYGADKIEIDSTLTEGVYFRKALFGGKYKTRAYIVEIDLTNPDLSIQTIKAGAQANSLENLHKMIRLFDSTAVGKEAIAAVNANFWRAYGARAIGPTVVNGEPVETQRYKKWTSGFFGKDSRLYIDTFTIECEVEFRDRALNVDKVNRRGDSLETVLYNQYVGDLVPYVPEAVLENAFAKAIEDSAFSDETEIELDSTEMKKTILNEESKARIEYEQPKITAMYLSEPAINKELPCLVISGEYEGSALVPKGGVVLSFSCDFPLDSMPKPGDTLNVRFSTNVLDTIEFYNAVCGTPRLVRKGRAKHEAREEGSTSKRFISRKLPRTALGTNKSGNKIFFAAVEKTNWSEMRIGASLTIMANIMKKIGCYDAVNLDGGGSTTMIVNGKNLLRANPNASRNISVGLGVFKKRSGN